MAISNIYVYFNEKGEVVSKAPYIDTGAIRQGSDFKLNILFDEKTNIIKHNDMISIQFKCPGESKYNLFPFLSFYDKCEQSLSNNLKFTGPTEISFEENLTKYGIQKEITYQCWTFDSVDAYTKGLPVLTEKDGNLEVQVTIYENGKLTTPKTCLGTFRIFIERTLNYESPFDVSQQDLDRFVKEIQEITRVRGFGIHTFEIDSNTGDLKVYAERSDFLVGDNYEIDPATGELILKI